MSISSTVAELARALEKHARETSDADPRLLARLEQLAEMPTYVESARLDQWEEQLLPARAEAEISPAFAAMVAILELGRINLYGEIDDELTAEYAANAVTALRATGMTVSDAETFDLADW
jgi:hypothetical protein